MSVLDSANEPMSLMWDNLSFQFIKKQWRFQGYWPVKRTTVKEILKPQSGEITSGTLTAVMGPSGSGKSTLLKCITGRYVTGVKGEISITSRSKKPRADIAFVPQQDCLFTTFSVRETLLFASKMKNLSSAVDHEDEVAQVMRSLNLEDCSALKIAKCSGGQVKRVCIGVELISRPDILVLDEPTTGLDSSTAFQCISLLRQLTRSKFHSPAIVATIHQPNYAIFLEFDSLYLVSRTGHKIYSGLPMGVIDHFARYGLICPNYCNPADFAIDVAISDCCDNLQSFMCNRYIKYKCSCLANSYELKSVLARSRRKKSSSLKNFIMLTGRNWQHSLKSSNQFWFKSVFTALVALTLSYFWVYRVGEDDGCWNAPDLLAEESVSALKINLTASRNDFMNKMSRFTDNASLLFMINMSCIFVSLVGPTMSFPLEAATLLREMKNTWYTPSCYFWAKTWADLPQIIISSVTICAIIYPLTGQIADPWRLTMFFVIIFLHSQVCQSLSTLIGIALANDVVLATFVSFASFIPNVLFAGFVARYSTIPWYFVPLTYVSFSKYTFTGHLITIYGFERCPSNATGTNFLDKFTQSHDPRSILRNLWTASRFKYKNVKRIARFLRVDEECMGQVFNNTASRMHLAYYDDASKNVSSSLTLPGDSEPAPGKGPSFVLDYFEIDQSTLWSNLACLIGYILFLQMIIFALLKIKSRATL